MPGVIKTEDQLQFAYLPKLEWTKLRVKDPSEIERLLSACQTYGFFYLNLATPTSNQLIQDWEGLLEFMEAYFHQPLEKKMIDDRKSDTHGFSSYEPERTSAGVKENEPDAYESLKVTPDELQNHAPAIPMAIQENQILFDRIMSNVGLIVMNLLETLSDALGLSGLARLENSHRDNEPSRTTLSMFRYPKQTEEDKGCGHNKHTDLGTITFLLCKQWGLQVLSPEKKDAWQFVKPEPGHAIINVGDSLRFLSGNRLLSAVHRVIPIGKRQVEDRYSIAYFLRPEDAVEFKDARGLVVSAKDWHDRKFDVFRESHAQQAQEEILTGGMEKNDRIVV
ncbi:hypothetical protein BP6252_13291 [Coleophoma cylindrospora]|uniref:Fe2OG dioxygenase domain-containing protein n=1 Tax=Coleophoma cylindrospora TaxID=1849047 RepID=A0A3D8QAE9_9HELO|nr:hypothetical protein BP6252_13291 [Coleophoma cylindrospora]